MTRSARSKPFSGDSRPIATKRRAVWASGGLSDDSKGRGSPKKATCQQLRNIGGVGCRIDDITGRATQHSRIGPGGSGHIAGVESNRLDPLRKPRAQLSCALLQDKAQAYLAVQQGGCKPHEAHFDAARFQMRQKDVEPRHTVRHAGPCARAIRQQ